MKTVLFLMVLAMPAFAETYQVTGADNGKAFSVAVGDTVEITITNGAGDGGWVVVPTQNNATVLKRVNDKLVLVPVKPHDPHQPPLVGGPHIEHFVFKAIAEGTSNLIFETKRFGRQKSIKTYHYDVTVQN